MLLNLSIAELSKKISAKEVKPSEIVAESMKNISDSETGIQAFISIQDDEKKLQPSESDSPLFGMTFSVKDAYVTKDLPTSAGSTVLQGFRSPYNATVIEKLQAAGAILVGKNSQDAWGHGSTNENTDVKVAKNPWNTKHVAGGSSGGSAAAVADRSVVFSIGEDTGGSIRNPAAFCGVCGLKVTYGRVSRWGAISYASSLDTMGPIAKSVEDIAYIMEVIAGQDNHDATSSFEPVPKYTELLKQDIRGKVIGLPKEFFAEGLDPEVKEAVQAAAEQFEKLGAKIIEVSLPSMSYAIPLYYLLAMSETSSNLGRYDGIRYGQDRSHFTPENMRRIILGTFALSAGYGDKLYKNAQKARNVLREEYQKALSQCDVLLGPVTPGPAPKLGELMDDPARLVLEDLFTVTTNPVGVPSLAIPCGFTKNNLPIGMQIIGKHFAEPELLALGYAYQQVTDWHTRKPPVVEERV